MSDGNEMELVQCNTEGAHYRYTKSKTKLGVDFMMPKEYLTQMLNNKLFVVCQ